MARTEKIYEGKSFVLEKTKLTRLVGVIEEALGSECVHKFCTYTKSGTTSEYTQLADVLSADNSRRNEIKRVISESSFHEELGAYKKIEVDFGRKIRSPSGSENIGVFVSVEGGSIPWRSRTLAAIDEQVERTWVNNSLIKIACILIMIFSLFMIVSPLSSTSGISSDMDLSGRMWLTRAQVASLAKNSKDKPLTQDDIGRVMLMRIENLHQYDEAKAQTEKYISIKELIFAIIPFLVVLILAFCIIVFLLPSAVFLWGDEEERQRRRINIRNIIWSLIFGMTVVATFGQLFSERILHIFGK